MVGLYTIGCWRPEEDWSWFRASIGPLIERAIREMNEEFRLAREQGDAGS